MKYAKILLVILFVATVAYIKFYQPMFWDALILGLERLPQGLFEFFIIVLPSAFMSFLRWMVPNGGAAFLGVCCVFSGFMLAALMSANPRAELEEKIFDLSTKRIELEKKIKEQEGELAKVTADRDFLRQGFQTVGRGVRDTFENLNKELGKALLDMIDVNKTLTKRVKQVEHDRELGVELRAEEIQKVVISETGTRLDTFM